MNLEEQYGAHNYHPIPVVLSKAEGVWVWDVKGKKYLDCLSSYSAVNQGHRHPKVLKAMTDQMKELTLTSRAFFNDKLGLYLKKLCEFAGMEVALPMNTGVEAVETGIKIARRWGYRIKKIPKDQAEIIVCENNFHGRTTTIVGFSTDPNATTDFGPATPGFKIIPFNNPTALENAITPNTAAFLVEPIQGEAGVLIPDEGYLRRVKEICNRNNVLLIFDEIQTGFCRTGKRFAFQHEDAKPDILLVGKALGGGVFPISAAITRKEIMDVITPGSHGSTFGGNPLACAIGIVAMEIVEEEQLAKRSAELGEYFLNKLRAIKSDRIKELRGKGLFIAVEIKEEYGPCRPITEALMKKGVLAKETHEQTIRFAPPLVIEKETIDWAIDIIEDCIVNTVLPDLPICSFHSLSSQG
ncbi:MAG: ornithine--oxo-acid transaminase [Candidatus Hodarchaeota archaeon]